MTIMNIYIISLLNSTERRAFQKEQLNKLDLKFEFLDATSTDDISAETYEKHKNDWQRPLRNAEVACYFSHQNAWHTVIDSNQPALILEDDALLSKCVPELLKSLSNKKDIDLITLENRGRKKFVAKSGVSIGCGSKLLRLYQDRTGAAGYILYPNGAKKLIEQQRKKGIALADAHITACYSLKAYQVEPTPIIQIDQCKYYGINNPTNKITAKTIIDGEKKPKTNPTFRVKRILSQFKLGLHQLMLLIKSERRTIKINKSNFKK